MQFSSSLLLSAALLSACVSLDEPDLDASDFNEAESALDVSCAKKSAPHSTLTVNEGRRRLIAPAGCTDHATNLSPTNTATTVEVTVGDRPTTQASCSGTILTATQYSRTSSTAAWQTGLGTTVAGLWNGTRCIYPLLKPTFSANSGSTVLARLAVSASNSGTKVSVCVSYLNSMGTSHCVQHN